MRKKPNVYLLLPAYNEGQALADLLPKALAVRPALDIMVLDDGSTDDTASVVRRFPGVRLLQHDLNRGLGAGLRSLIREALAEAKPEDLLITMDADDTMDPNLIPSMVREADRNADIVIASRFAGGSEHGVPWRRKVFARGARLVITGLFPLRGVRDYTCGFRLYRVRLLEYLHQVKPNLFDSKGFTASTELLLNLSHWHPKIVEVPLHLRYDRKASRSKMRVALTLWQYLQLFFRLKFRNDLAGSVAGSK